MARFKYKVTVEFATKAGGSLELGQDEAAARVTLDQALREAVNYLVEQYKGEATATIIGVRCINEH